MKQYSFLLESNIQNSIDLLKKILSKIQYGLRNPKTNKKELRGTLEDYDRMWRLATSEETISSGVGICWDTVELIRDFLSKHNIEFKMFYSQTSTYEDPTHTYVLYKDNGKWKWIERSWSKYQYNNLEFDSWLDGAKKITKILTKELVNHHKYSTYLLDKYPKPGCNTKEFIQFCTSRKRII